MNRCRICGLAEEKAHAACVRRLFGAARVPVIDLALKEIAVETQKIAGKMSISGVQPKLSVARKGGRLVPVAAGGTHILKPQTQAFRNLPENEQLCMSLAARLGIDVPPHGLLNLSDGSAAYVVKRFDRAGDGAKLRCEHFAQILGRDKYEGSVEAVGRKLAELSEFPGLDTQLLFERVLFNFLVGNGDAHLKNHSILEQADGTLRLAPAYDLLCSKLVVAGEDESALAINGRKNKLTLGDFSALARQCGIGTGTFNRLVERLRPLKDLAHEETPDSRLGGADKERMTVIIDGRWSRIYA